MPEAAPWASPPPEAVTGADGNGGPPAAYPPRLTRLDAFPGDGRTRVAVQGELDLDACEEIGHDLYEALSRSVRGLDLHLDAVPFFDCAGLNMLLRLRTRALAQGKTVVVRSSSRAVERLLDLTGARKLFISPRPYGPCVPCPTVDGAVPHQDRQQDAHEDSRQGLPAEVAQLRRAMQTRPVIDLARGILMATFTLSPEAAWAVLVTASQNTNTKLHFLARDLVDSVQGGALPEAVQEQLAAAVAKARAAPSRPAAGE
ncbi:ANTAR domain-containing protein [Streptomyces albofaciens JCM 4342]|uniref:ANTAR domain-containing protein n=1 Tax=Streptomyces albofaciens TaxID=66866 RepID=UPI001239BBC3|nr:ANTAR domain-containing protein [Streptomyces albofaciens]KAA6212446.1 ANTAR domain-containing protein [Streptomyces albofaciens JCM 4342]